MRQRRPLALVALWLIFSSLAALFPALPQLPDLPPAESAGLRLFDLLAEPALIVFQRDGGLTATDRSFVATVAADLTAQVLPATDQATHILALDAQPATIPNLRSKLTNAPAGLTSYVTGAAALLFDSAASWQNVRWLSLLLAPLLIGFITLFSRFGPRRVLVIILTTFSAGAVSSALAALIASAPAVAATRGHGKPHLGGRAGRYTLAGLGLLLPAFVLSAWRRRIAAEARAPRRVEPGSSR